MSRNVRRERRGGQKLKEMGGKTKSHRQSRITELLYDEEAARRVQMRRTLPESSVSLLTLEIRTTGTLRHFIDVDQIPLLVTSSS
jgi:hypothetical protein